MDDFSQLTEFPAKIIQAVGCDETIVQLLTNDPDVDMDSEEADSVFDKYLFDYLYVDETTDESEAYICVETELERSPSPTISDMRIYVDVICHKNYMHLTSDRFPAVMGNRRENLCKNIVRVLADKAVSMKFGIGALDLVSIKTIPSPAGFVARELIYEIPTIHAI